MRLFVNLCTIHNRIYRTLVSLQLLPITVLQCTGCAVFGFWFFGTEIQLIFDLLITSASLVFITDKEVCQKGLTMIRAGKETGMKVN